MRLPSIRAAWDEAQRTLSRFPLVLIAAGLATASGWIVFPSGSGDSASAAILAASTLGLALLTAVAVASERLGSRTASILLQALSVATLVVIGFAWHGWSDSIRAHRYMQFSVGFHLLVAFLPYVAVAEPNGFWQYNRALFLRFCLAALYSGVLYVGLVVALVAVDQLFKAHVAPVVYARLWLVIAFAFNTWFFLAGVPRDLRALEEDRSYPRGLKVFTQFVLIPLVVIYLLILTTYLGRILVTGQWPSGWIGYLVSSVATVGILSLLLVHPIREEGENRWVGTYARWFYVAMLPSIGMLLVAIGKRIGQYGVTEDRYFLSILALWLAGIAIGYIARRNAGIRAIPVTLCLLAFLTAFGPLGAYGASRRSQVARLRGLLAQAHVAPGGKTRAASADVSFDVRRELSSTLTYLIGTHGVRSLRGVLDEEVTSGLPHGKRPSGTLATEGARSIMTRWGLFYVEGWQPKVSQWFTYSGRRTGPMEAVPISGVDYHVTISGTTPIAFTVAGEKWTLDEAQRGRVLALGRNGASVLEFPADTLIGYARAHGPLDSLAGVRLVAGSGASRAILSLRSYSGTLEGDSTRFSFMEGDLYLALGRAP